MPPPWPLFFAQSYCLGSFTSPKRARLFGFNTYTTSPSRGALLGAQKQVKPGSTPTPKSFAPWQSPQSLLRGISTGLWMPCAGALASPAMLGKANCPPCSPQTGKIYGVPWQFSHPHATFALVHKRREGYSVASNESRLSNFLSIWRFFCRKFLRVL